MIAWTALEKRGAGFENNAGKVNYESVNLSLLFSGVDG